MGKMSRRHQINIMGPLGNQFKVYLSEPFHTDFLSMHQFRYLIILAIYTGQVTPGKEYCTSSTGSTDTGLFPVVKGRP
jgi:hypothetical protein